MSTDEPQSSPLGTSAGADRLDDPPVASERIARALAEEILRGTLKPGARLRQEEIAARFGASRLPVREALRMLEADGLVELTANRGGTVTRLSLEECGFLYGIRELVEPLVLGESIPHLAAADVERIQDLRQRAESARSVEEFLAADRALHLATYAACPMESGRDLVRHLWNLTQGYRRAIWSVYGEERRWVIFSEHELLVDAVCRSDVETAKSLLATHIRRTKVELLRHPEALNRLL